MSTGLDVQRLSAMLHELAEGLQATGNYLSALRRRLAEADEQACATEIAEQAISQWYRAQHAARELRAALVQIEQDKES